MTIALVLLFAGIALIVIFVANPKNSPKEEKTSDFNNLCLASHESYDFISGSILANYSRVAVAVDNAYCSKIGK